MKTMNIFAQKNKCIICNNNIYLKTCSHSFDEYVIRYYAGKSINTLSVMLNDKTVGYFEYDRYQNILTLYCNNDIFLKLDNELNSIEDIMYLYKLIMVFS